MGLSHCWQTYDAATAAAFTIASQQLFAMMLFALSFAISVLL